MRMIGVRDYQRWSEYNTNVPESSTITLNMHEYDYEYSENKCTRVRVRLLYNILEYVYDYFRM